jgi:hypothetical protein
MFCPKCGAELDKDDEFCPKYGTKVKKSIESKEKSKKFGIGKGILILFIICYFLFFLFLSQNPDMLESDSDMLEKVCKEAFEDFLNLKDLELKCDKDKGICRTELFYRGYSCNITKDENNQLWYYVYSERDNIVFGRGKIDFTQ